jgi:hypothetical protein
MINWPMNRVVKLTESSVVGIKFLKFKKRKKIRLKTIFPQTAREKLRYCVLGGDGNAKSTKMRILQDRTQLIQKLCKSTFSTFQQYLRQFSFNMAAVLFL